MIWNTDSRHGKRSSPRVGFETLLTLSFENELTLTVVSENVNMLGMFLLTDVADKDRLVGQQGILHARFGIRTRSFPFKVVRATSQGIGIQITKNIPEYARTVIAGVFGNGFTFFPW